jgi:hypothetical protein
MFIDLVNKKVLICGKSGSGKSVLCRFLVRNQLDAFDKVYLISPTESLNKDFRGIVPETNIKESFEEDWLEQLFKSLTHIRKFKKEPYNTLLIVDDCGSDEGFKNSDVLKKIMVRGRHCNLAVIVCLQYIYQIGPLMRSQFNFVCCGQSNQQSLGILCDDYLMGPIDKRQFVQMYHKHTQNRKFLVINCDSVEDNENINEIYGCVLASMD